METNNTHTIVPERGTIVSATEGIIDNEHPKFIESNTGAATMKELSHCIVPTFSDNSLTIAHQQFIDVVREAATNVFGEPPYHIALRFGFGGSCCIIEKAQSHKSR